MKFHWPWKSHLKPMPQAMPPGEPPAQPTQPQGGTASAQGGTASKPEPKLSLKLPLGVEVKEAEVDKMSRTGIHRAWKAGQLTDPKGTKK